MTKITFIGAGSQEFTSELVQDTLTFPLLEDATISLMDINAERLEFARRVAARLIGAGNRTAKVTATLERAEAQRNADVVLATILSGSTDVWRYDIEIPKKFGVDINVGDTLGPSGIEEMALQAAIDGNPVAAFRAIAHVPLTVSVLSLSEIKQIVNGLFTQHKDYLPMFETHMV
jgi:alpha-galactosidase/6-phospho-beta-glucosidase family protein